MSLIAGPAAAAPGAAGIVAPAVQSVHGGAADTIGSAGTQASTATVPNVVGQDIAPARAAVQAAGFLVRTRAGIVDCGPTYVQRQSPAGGTSAPVGSTVVLTVNRQPGAGEHCP